LGAGATSVPTATRATRVRTHIADIKRALIRPPRFMLHGLVWPSVPPRHQTVSQGGRHSKFAEKGGGGTVSSDNVYQYFLYRF
jgi:hypothetical protein